jgi:hypothetical protein
LTPIGNFAHTINPQPVRFSNSILDSDFNDDILETLVPDLVPNFDELDLLNHEVYY